MNHEPGNRSLERPGGGLLRKGLRRDQPALFEMAENDRRQLDFNAMLIVIRHRKWTVLAVTAAALALAVWHLNSLTPLYTSKATVMLETQEDRVVDVQAVSSGLSRHYFTINTEVEVLQSRLLIGRLADDMNLVEDPVFNPWIRPVTGWRQSSWGRPIASALGLSTEPVKREPPSAEVQRNTVVAGLARRFRVVNLESTYVFEILATTPDRQKSAALANRLAELYILEQLEAKFEATQSATAWLSGRVADLKIALEEAEAEVEEFRATTQLVNEEELEIESGGLKELRERMAQITVEADTAQTTLDLVLEAKDAENPARVVELLASPRVARAYAETEAGDGEAMAAFWDEVENQIAQIRQQRDRMKRQIEAARVAVADFEGRIERQGKDLVTLRQLMREAESSRLIYEHFLSRMKEISAQEGIQPADSRILNRAVPSGGASYPRRRRNLTMALIVGFLAGAGFVVWREMYRPAFRSAEDLEKATGVRVMGNIPRAPVRRRGDLLNYIINKPSSSLAEAARNLRTSLLLGDAENSPKVVVSASSVPGEGKTTLTVLLAQNSAALGKRVLVIECDLRKRTLDAYFGGSLRQRGLISVLYGEAAFEEVVLHDELAGIDVILGEESAMNAADIFASRQFGEFIGEMREKYDFVVIDTPPIMAVPDARLIASLGDALIYSVAWDRTSRDLVLAGLDQLREVDVPMVGLALTKIDVAKASRYGYGGYGQYYRVGKGYYKN